MTHIIKDLKLEPGSDADLLWTGKALKAAVRSKYVKTPLGKTQVYDTPKYIAQRLGRDDWNKFSGHSGRRTAGTHMADMGAQVPQLQAMFGWKHPATCAEYVDNSKFAQKVNAGMMGK